jgi:hypothetical protein
LNFETTVSYRGVEFEVAGEYIPLIPGKPYRNDGDPGYEAEGDYFEEFDIRVGGGSIYELLVPAEANRVEDLALDMAREAARERGRKWAY